MPFTLARFAKAEYTMDNIYKIQAGLWTLKANAHFPAAGPDRSANEFSRTLCS